MTSENFLTHSCLNSIYLIIDYHSPHYLPGQYRSAPLNHCTPNLPSTDKQSVHLITSTPRCSNSVLFFLPFSQADSFQRTSTRVARKYWWKNVKLMIIIGIVVLIIVILIILLATGTI